MPNGQWGWVLLNTIAVGIGVTLDMSADTTEHVHMQHYLIESRSGTWLPTKDLAQAFELRREWMRRHPALDWLISNHRGKGDRLGTTEAVFALKRARDGLYRELTW